jgi:hypothetical protein
MKNYMRGLIICTLHQILLDNQTKQDAITGTSSKNKMGNIYKMLVGKPEEKRPYGIFNVCGITEY